MIDALERLCRRVQLMVGRGRLTIVDDSQAAQLLQVRTSAAGLSDKVPRLAEYGFQSHPPAGADAVLLFLAGNSSDGVVVATGHQQYRIRSLKAGEVAISDDKGQVVHLSETGIRINSGALPVQIDAGGGLVINADITIIGTVTANGKAIDDTHIHSNGTRIDGMTGTPV